MGGEGSAGEGGSAGSRSGEEGSGSDVHDGGGRKGLYDGGASLAHPGQSPLFHAEHADRYDRQELIRAYEERFDCRLIVMIDAIFAPSITYLEELIYDADPSTDLHLILDSPGGDGEVAVRLVRSAQARCRELTVIVPDRAKSAGTILALGAHHILMGPASDLGPVDPQFPVGQRGLVAAKDIIAAVESAEVAIAANPAVFPLHAALLADVTDLMVQQARSAIARTDELVDEALKSNGDRNPAELTALKAALKEPLIEAPKDHGAIFSAADAENVGLPVKKADPSSDQWRIVWRLWARYFMIAGAIYEGRRASRINLYSQQGHPGG